MTFLRLLPLAALLLCACDKSGQKANSPDDEISSPREAWIATVKEAEKKLKIEELESEIENSTQIISDMEAFIQMERTKIEDDPEYDQSFMEEALTGQDEQRELIEQARKQIEELKSQK